MSSMQERLTARFLRYAAINSQSVEGAPVVPSTPGQRQLAELLKSDLAELGLVDLEISEYSVLTGHAQQFACWLPQSSHCGLGCPFGHRQRKLVR